MAVFIVLALLASNILLAKMLLAKDNRKCDYSDEVSGKSAADEKGESTPDTKTESENVRQTDDRIAAVVGESKYDPDTYKKIAEEVVKEVVPIIIREYGTFADAVFADSPAYPESGIVPDEMLDDVFSSKSVSDLTGEAPDPAEPRADGIDFNDINTTMNVIEEKSDNPEDIAVAQETLRELDGTIIKEKLSLDPEIQKRVLLIELHLPSDNGESDGKEQVMETSDKPDATSDNRKKPKKILFHADIDTTDIDTIDLNLLH